MDLAAVEPWIRRAVEPTGPLELVKERPWATVLRVPIASGSAFFKACRSAQAFEPTLSAELARRWPDRVGEVLAHDPERAWLLTADAGEPVGWSDESLAGWLELLPRYAELQVGEAGHVQDHLAGRVPDLRPERLPGRFDELLAGDLPLATAEVEALRAFRPRFAALCRELEGMQPVSSIQHDDLHARSVFRRGSAVRVLDWGDASIGQPFFSLVRLDLSLEETGGTALRDRWFPRLRDAYLEPWGRGLRPAFDAAHRLGLVAHLLTWHRHRAAMSAPDRASFDLLFEPVLRRALHRVSELEAHGFAARGAPSGGPARTGT